MWAIDNNTPFATDRCWVRDRDGAEVWLVAVKGSFTIGPQGSLKVADEQEPVCLAPQFVGDPATSSLRYDSDLPHKKLRTDVILHGHAYAPEGKPVTQTGVRLTVSDIDKTLRVFGDRIWEDSLVGLRLSSPRSFIKMPLTYERAFGGTDTIEEEPKHRGWEPRNPIGAGFAAIKKHLIGAPAPNVERVGDLIGSWNDRPDPIGFGPIPGHWAPRTEYAGTYDEEWEKSRLPLIAEDFDEQFYQCAPEDQQVPYLKGGELVELSNLTPVGRIRFRLPRVSLGFETEFSGGEKEIHRSYVHTVILEPDVPRVMIVWHTHVPCHHRVLELLVTSVYLKQRIFTSDLDAIYPVWVGEPENA